MMGQNSTSLTNIDIEIFNNKTTSAKCIEFLSTVHNVNAKYVECDLHVLEKFKC